MSEGNENSNGKLFFQKFANIVLDSRFWEKANCHMVINHVKKRAAVYTRVIGVEGTSAKFSLRGQGRSS
jgi:hypothetical protein